MDLKRLSGESPIEHHKRLVYGKLVDKTLSDIDYTELSEYLYGQPYSSDVARRMMYGSRRTLDLIDSVNLSSISDSDYAKEIDEKIIELKKERQKFYDQRREYSRILSSEAREEHMMSELCRSASELSETIGDVYKDIDPYSFQITNDSNSDAVLVLSDWHYGLNTKNAFNSYNIEVCKKRVRAVAEKALQKILLHECKQLHVIVLGDLIHGAIHNSARVASEELVCDQLMQASELLAQTIDLLSSFVVKTNVYITYGNHARTVQNKNDSIHRDNTERLIPWWLKQRFSSKENISIEEDNGTEFVFVDVNGYSICASHGDNDSVKTSPRILHALFQNKYNKNINCMIFGDKHHRESFEELGIDSMLCGALCGSDDYANGKRLYSSPSQLMLIINNGELDAEYRIKCDV